MSDVEIKYNNKRVPISGTGPTPYLSLSKEVLNYGDRWGLVDKITLAGLITGSNFDALYFAQTGLVDIFSSSFKTLEIFEGPDGAIGYVGNLGNGGNTSNAYSQAFSFTGCSIESINFDNAGYNKVVGYSVEMLSYPSGFFSGAFRILDPKDEIRISENNDGFGTITHSVAAKGFVYTSPDVAITHLKNYVSSRTGINNILTVPIVSGIENSGSFTPVLVNVSENLDRLNLDYSVEETYRFKMYSGDTEAQNNYSFNNYYLTSYSTDLSSGAGEDFVTANIRGEIKAGITGATGENLISGLVSQLNALNPYQIISGKYGSPNGFKFCTDPIQFGIEEDLKSRSIKFNASYDNLEFYSSSNDKYVYSGCYLDASVNHVIDNLTSIDRIQIRGDIKCRGSVKHRYDSSLLYLGQLMTAGSSASFPRLYDFANDYYNSYYSAGSKFALNTTPLSLVVNANPFLGTISIDASFDNRDRFSDLSASDYYIEYTPCNTVFTNASSCNVSKKHLAVDMNVKKREKVSVNLTLSGPSSTESNLVNSKETIFSSFVSYFISALINDASSYKGLQIEDSAMSLQNSTSTKTLNTTNNTIVSANRTYSYELRDIIKLERAVLKSKSQQTNIIIAT